MKVLNFNLSKILNDLWLLNSIDTEFKYYKNGYWYVLLHQSEFYANEGDCVKTLTIEETISFLKDKVNSKNGYQDIWNAYLSTLYKWWSNIDICFEFCDINKLEKIIEYLSNEKLLIK